MQKETPSRHRILHDEDHGEPQNIKWYERFHLILPNNPNKSFVTNFQAVKVWGRKPGEEITNVFSLRKTIHSTGVGADPYEAYEKALEKINERRKKRNAEIILQTAGFCLRNGANFYYILETIVFKIKNPSQ